MNERIAHRQLHLVRIQNDHQQKQIREFANIFAEKEIPVDKKARIYFFIGLCLTEMASDLAKSIDTEVDVAFRELKKMEELPDSEQWEYRIARSLGVAEGLNAITALFGKIMAQRQTALHNSALLEMSDDKLLCLPVHTNGQQDYLHVIAEEADRSQRARLRAAWLMAERFTATFRKDAIRRDDNDALTIASICSCACDLVTAGQLASLSWRNGQMLRTGMNTPDLGGQEKSNEYKTARMTAAAVVSGLISELVQKNLPWLMVNLN